jgi:hypothetical protein
MSGARGLLRELIERRLWPVAVLLLVAAVAVPMYLGRSTAEDAAVAPVVTAQPDATASKAAVSIEAQAELDRRGGVRNPFKQLHVPKAATPSTTTGATTSTPAAGTTTTGGSTGSGSGGAVPPVTSGGTGGTGTGTGTGTATPSADPLDTHHLTLRFGRTDAAGLKAYRDVARLSPLPNAENPFFVYTGVLKDGKTAVFLLSSDVVASGDGHCRPSAASCQTIEVKEGDTEYFDLVVAGQPVQYQLDVVRVYNTGASSVGAAAAAYERHSDAGAALLRQAHQRGGTAFKGAADYRWLPDSGTLVRTPEHAKVRASANGAVVAAPADAAGALPGLPVWHWQLDG